MRRGVVVLLAAVLGCAQSTGPGSRPTISVAGLISNGMGQPVPDTALTVRSYAPNSCGTGTIIDDVESRSNASGIYRVSFISLSPTYTACIRVTVGTTTRDTTVMNLPQYSTVQVNVSLP